MNRPFLTDLDPQGAIKGSRDPLSIQSIWTRFGRQIIGNLSTVTTSVRDFAVLLLGYHFAERVSETAGPGTELATFLKWEQLAGYARASVNEERSFRGTERVWRNLEEDTVTLSTAAEHQILSNQKLYGLWGLYSVPSRSSGLLDGDPARLTAPAQELVAKHYLPRLTADGFKEGQRIVELIAGDSARLDPRGGDKRLMAAVGNLLGGRLRAPECALYREHLLYGGPQDPTDGRQRQLVALLEPKLREPAFQWSPPALLGLAKEAENNSEEWHPLAGRLRRISVVENLLAPASMLFMHLLGCHEVSVEDLTGRIRQAWGPRLTTVSGDDFSALQSELAGGDESTGQRWVAIAQAMAEGDYSQLIRLLLAQNRAVMQLRGGAAAWIEEVNGRLVVRSPDEQGQLPTKRELPDLWLHPYFLNSLAGIAYALEENGHD